MLKTVFNKEQNRAFVKPINALTSIINDEDGGIIINFEKDKKEAAISAKKDSAGVVAFIKYKQELFDNLEVDKDEKIGILKLGDFIKYFSIIDDDKTEIGFDSNAFVISDSENKFDFKTADVDMIKEGPKTFKGATYLAEIQVDEKFDKLKKAINVLSNEDTVFIKGSAADSTVSFTVKSSSIEINKFNIKISTPVTSDFEVPFNKDYFSTALSIPVDTLKLSITERFITVFGDSKYYSLTYFIAKKTIK